MNPIKTPPAVPLSLFFQGKTKELLEYHQKGVDLNALSDIGEIDWFDLFYHHHYACFSTLAMQGALNVHAQESNGHNAIHALVASLQQMHQSLSEHHPGLNALDILLRSGLSLEDMNFKKQTALESCLDIDRRHRPNTPLLLRLLVQRGAEITSKTASLIDIATLVELERVQLSRLSLESDGISLRLKRL